MGVTPVSTGQKKTVLLPYITRCDNTGERLKYIWTKRWP